MTDAPLQPELLVERAVRAAAHAGNRLLSGSAVRVDVSADGPRRALLNVLSLMGARLVSGSMVDFVFVDTFEQFEPQRAVVDPATPAAAGLDAIVVSLEGQAQIPRGDSAAARIAWAARGMPATAQLAALLATEIVGKRPRIAVSLVLEPKTAAFVLTLADAGCEVALFSAVAETDPEIARAITRDGRVSVFAPTDAAMTRGMSDERCAELDSQHAAATLAWGPEYLIDDGAHLIRLAHTGSPEALARLQGAAEETTSGVRPLRDMAERGQLKIPVIAVNDARTKTGFDNLIGTGQSCVFAIADLLDAARWQPPGSEAIGVGYAGMAGTRWAVIGYGPVGEGTARFAAALGAQVTVVERDPVRALAALHNGHEAQSMTAALATADVVVSATGVWHTLEATHIAALRPGAVVAVAGGIDEEIALDQLRAAGWTRSPGAGGGERALDEWCAPGKTAGPIVLAGGGGVNYTAAEGNPIEVMDLSFATQLAALLRLFREQPAPGVHMLSAAEERLVARAALTARGGETAAPPVAQHTGGAAQPWYEHRYRGPKPGH